MKKRILLGAFALGLTAAFFTPVNAHAGVSPESRPTVVEVVDNREYADLVIAQVNDYVNIRSGPSTDYEILGKLYNNSVGHYVEDENGWTKITSGSVTGYVCEEYVVKGVEALKIAREVEITLATIDTSVLNVRSEPNTDSDILGTFGRGEELVVVDTEDGFAKVDYNNKKGYISLDYVKLHTEFVEAESIEEERARLAAEEKARKEAQRAAEAAIAAQRAKEVAAAQAAQAAAALASSSSSSSNSDASLGQQVVDYAVQFVGNPYVYGGTSLTNGCDCSGFVQSVYSHFGVALPRTGQRNSGYEVGSMDQAKPGDILCYSGHVAIYMGNGQIVHAATPSQGIVIGSAYYATIINIRRIF